MDGLWTVFTREGMPETVIREGRALYTPKGYEAVPVIPCDDETIERVARRRAELHWERSMVAATWESTFERDRESWRRSTREFFQLAAEVQR